MSSSAQLQPNRSRILQVDMSRYQLPPEQLIQHKKVARFVLNRLAYRRVRAAAVQGLLSDEGLGPNPVKRIEEICLSSGHIRKDFVSDEKSASELSLDPASYRKVILNFLGKKTAVDRIIQDITTAIRQIQSAEALIFDADNNLWYAKMDYAHIQNLAGELMAAGLRADRPAGKEGIAKSLEELSSSCGLGKWQLASFIIGVNGSLNNEVFKTAIREANAMGDMNSDSFKRMADNLVLAGLKTERKVGPEELAESLRELYYSCSFQKKNVASFIVGLGGSLDRNTFELAMNALGSMPKEDRVLFPSSKPALESLRAMRPNGNRMKMCFFSDAPRAMAEERLAWAGLEHYFDAFVFSPEHSMVKPDPDLFRIAMDSVNVRHPTRAVMIGDSLEKDIVGAHRTGMPNILVNYGFRNDYQAFQERGLVKKGIFVLPSIELSDLSQVPKLFSFEK